MACRRHATIRYRRSNVRQQPNRSLCENPDIHQQKFVISRKNQKTNVVCK